MYLNSVIHSNSTQNPDDSAGYMPTTTAIDAGNTGINALPDIDVSGNDLFPG